MINISLGDWFRLVLVVFHVGNALKHELQNLIWIDILIKFPLNPHLKYTECFLVFIVKPGLVVRWYQNSELLGKPELLMLSIEKTFGSVLSSSPPHSQTQDWVTEIALFYSQRCCHRELKHLTLFMEQSFWACLFVLLWGKTSSWPQGWQLSPPKSLTSPQTAAKSRGVADGHCLGLIVMLKNKDNLYSTACLLSWISQIELILLLQFAAF